MLNTTTLTLNKNNMRNNLLIFLNSITPEYSNSYDDKFIAIIQKTNQNIIDIFEDRIFTLDTQEFTYIIAAILKDTHLHIVSLQEPILEKSFFYFKNQLKLHLPTVLSLTTPYDTNSHQNQYIKPPIEKIQLYFKNSTLGKKTENHYKNIAISLIHKIQLDYNISTIINKHNSWEIIAEWAKKMHTVIGKNADLFNIPKLNLFHKKITILYTEDSHTSNVGFAMTDHNHNNIIKINIDTTDNMLKFWTHEYTHCLDSQSGYLYQKQNHNCGPLLPSQFLSHYILNGHYIIDENTDFSTSNLINLNKFLLSFSLNGTDSTTFIEQQQDKEKIIKHIQSSYFVHLFDQTNYSWESISKSDKYKLVNNDKFLDFINELITTAQDYGNNHVANDLVNVKEQHYSTHNMLQLKFYCFLNELETILPKDINFTNISEKAYEPSFNISFCHGIFIYMKQSGLCISNLGSYHASAYISHSEQAMASMDSINSSYWAKPLEMVARCVEKLNEHPTKKFSFTKFKTLVYSELNSVIAYPNQLLYNEENKTKIKQAVKSMYEYIEQQLIKQNQVDNTSPKILEIRKKLKFSQSTITKLYKKD
jgi:hypothetical protein